VQADHWNMVVILTYDEDPPRPGEKENTALAAYLGWPGADLKGDAFLYTFYANDVTGSEAAVDPTGLVVNGVPLQAALQQPGLQFYDKYFASWHGDTRAVVTFTDRSGLAYMRPETLESDKEKENDIDEEYKRNYEGRRQP
jgi:hypothetical protein